MNEAINAFPFYNEELKQVQEKMWRRVRGRDAGQLQQEKPLKQEVSNRVCMKSLRWSNLIKMGKGGYVFWVTACHFNHSLQWMRYVSTNTAWCCTTQTSPQKPSPFPGVKSCFSQQCQAHFSFAFGCKCWSFSLGGQKAFLNCTPTGNTVS